MDGMDGILILMVTIFIIFFVITLIGAAIQFIATLIATIVMTKMFAGGVIAFCGFLTICSLIDTDSVEFEGKRMLINTWEQIIPAGRPSISINQSTWSVPANHLVRCAKMDN